MTVAPQDTRNPLWTPVAWGVLVGVLQAASPLAFWWLEPATVYALSLVAIAFVYIGSPSPTAGGRSSPSRPASRRCSW